jgi:hypothetical protein
MRKDPASKAVPKTVVTDSIDLKARRMATRLWQKKGARRATRPPDQPNQGRQDCRTAFRHGGRSPVDPVLHDSRPGEEPLWPGSPSGQPAPGDQLLADRGCAADFCRNPLKNQ